LFPFLLFHCTYYFLNTPTRTQVQEPSISVSGLAVPRIARVQIEGALVQGDNNNNEPMADLWVPLDAELACQVHGGVVVLRGGERVSERVEKDLESEE
jgi:hypothetical protein